MADSADPPKPLRVLVSEGSSTSAREAITILGLSGHHVEVCDPSPYCLARFSRFVANFIAVRACGTTRPGFSAFVEQLLSARPFRRAAADRTNRDFCSRGCGNGCDGRVGLALPSFDNYRTAHSKAGFSRLLDRIGFAAATDANRDIRRELRTRDPLSLRGQDLRRHRQPRRLVRAQCDDLEGALRELATGDAFADEVLVQELVAGTTEKAQSVFCRGRLIGFHAYRQIAAGVGGGEAIKQSVRRPQVRAPCRPDRASARLAWRVVGRLYLARRRHHAAV